MLLRLYSAAASYDPPAFDVHVTRSLYESLTTNGMSLLGGHPIQHMPERYHFDDNLRIAPIYVTPRVGWALTNRQEHVVDMGGNYEPRGVS